MTNSLGSNSLLNPFPFRVARRQAFARLLAFFAASFALAWTAWLAVILVKGLPSRLALVGLGAPALAALVVAVVSGGPREVRTILRRFAPVRIKMGCWLLAIAVMPTVYGIAALAVGDHQSIHWLLNANSWWFLPLSFVYLLAITAGEEIGWRGYALPLMLEARIPPLLAAISLGLIWGVWHIPLRIPSGLSTFPLPLFIPFTTLLSIVYLVLFQQSRGSLLPALALHASTDFAPRVIDISRLSWRFWLVVNTATLLVVAVLWVLGYARNDANGVN